MPRGIDPLSKGFAANPYPVYTGLRGSAPVAFIESIDAYMVTSHDLVVEVLADTETFSNRRDTLGVAPSPDLQAALDEIRGDGWPHIPTIADEDPPVHDQLKTVVAPFFTPSYLRRFQPVFEAICHDLIDQWDEIGEVEFVGEFANPLPLRAISVILDLPTDDPDAQAAMFARWRDDAVVAVGTQVPDMEMLAAEHGIVEMQHYFAERVARADDPDQDLFAALKAAEFTDTEGVRRKPDMAEILTMARQIFIGGIETTAKAITETMLQLTERPDEFARLHQNAAHSRRVVEESLRLSSPAQGIARTATRDVELGGVAIPAGARLFIMFAAANRDPLAHDKADLFDAARRRVGRHLAFGRGVHVCLGASLARLEMQTALEVLSRRVAGYRLRQSQVITYDPGFVLRGARELHLEIQFSD